MKPPPKTKRRAAGTAPATPSQRPPQVSATGLAATRFQKFETRRLHRREIRGAEYNPRLIDDFARAKLKKKLETRGLLQALVWNERTGNLVSGHQRLSILDDLEGSDDYALDVNVVRLSAKAEREENIFFNNPDVQGYFDPDKLGAMLADSAVELTLEQTGFEQIAIEEILAGTDYEDLFAEPVPEEVRAGVEALTEMSDARRAERTASDGPPAGAPAPEGASGPAADDAPRLASGELVRDPAAHARIIAARNVMREKIKAGVGNADTELFVVVTARTREERERVSLALGYPADQRYVDARELLFKLGIDVLADAN